METHFDVIILGAGPAGLACAKELKNSHKKVLIIEKNEIIGPKICAGGVTGQNSVVDLSKSSRALAFQKQVVKIGKIRRKLVLSSPIYIMNRKDLGEFQKKELEQSENFTFIKGEKVIEISDRNIETTKGVYNYDILVGADGSNSRVRRYLKLKSLMSYGQYYEIEEKRSELIWNFDCKNYGVGYIWEFPQINKVTVGIYYELEYLSHEKARAQLHEYMKKNYSHIDISSLKLYGAPINCEYLGYKFKQIYLIGDAAGFTSLTTGEGIGYALESGSIVGREIIEGVSKKNEIEKILEFKKRQEKGLASLKRKGKWANFYLHIFFALLKTKKFQKYIGS
ncbi:MAG: NAD(P)/FAD-dependent oxidoreductase [Fusobacteria bacterium]|nr:NAD(P)/FAD-dependent oxidoreductase [Fusobacteriota bacterium]